MSKLSRLRLANGHWRKKGNTPWKWFMDKAMILKKKYIVEKDKCECNYRLGMGPNLLCPVHGKDKR